MAARLRRGLPGQQGGAKTKRNGEYIDKLEKAFKEYLPDTTEAARKLEGKDKGRKQDAGGKAMKGATQGNRKVLTVLDKMRGGFGKGEQQEQTKDKIQHYEKAKRRLGRQNDQLVQIAEFVQEKALSTSLRFTTEIQNLQQQLDHASSLPLDEACDISALTTLNQTIQDEIARLKGIAKQHAEEEKMVMERAFLKQVDSKSHELQDERKSGKNNAGEWLEKNRKLQEEVNRKLAKTEEKHSTSNKLRELNKTLRVEYSAQNDDKDILLQESEAVNRANVRLKTRVTEMENQVASMQQRIILARNARKHREGGDPPVPRNTRGELEGLLLGSLKNARDDTMSHHDRLAQYEDALQRMHALLEVERKNVKGVRAAHLAALSQRTELEVFLKSAIATVAADLRQGSAVAGQPVFTVADRRQVIEHVLSKERVLQLLYSDEGNALKTAAGAAGDERPEPELDMDELWNKWKQWSDNATM